MKRQKKDPTAWRYSADGHARYLVARAEAQARANESGQEIGLEANDLFRTFNSFALPLPQNRQGHELRCEVVRPERMNADGTYARIKS